MPYFSYKNIRISGVAGAVPTKVVSVDSFAAQNGRDTVEKFKEMTGIKSFRRAKEHQTASDLGFVAAERIIKEKSINRNTIGALVFVAHGTDYRTPATACVLHKRLGLSKDCAAFDINLGCSAIVYGLQVVCSMMSNSNIERALLIVSETITKMVSAKDRSINMMFGDGGVSFLLEKDENASDGISILLKTNGNGYNTIIAPAGGFRNLVASNEEMKWSDGNVRTLYNIFMNGTEVFAFSITDVPKTIKEFLALTNTSTNDYDCFAFHQANLFILKQLCKKIGIPIEKMPVCLDKYGNTDGAAAGLALCDKYGHRDRETLKTMFCCFGVGLSWGVAALTIDAADIYPIEDTDEIFYEGIINDAL